MGFLHARFLLHPSDGCEACSSLGNRYRLLDYSSVFQLFCRSELGLEVFLLPLGRLTDGYGAAPDGWTLYC